jgi:hypothetical protein
LPIFIGRGAPFANKTATICLRCLSAMTVGRTSSFPPDSPIIDLGGIDDWAEAALASFDIAVIQILMIDRAKRRSSPNRSLPLYCIERAGPVPASTAAA